MSGGRKGFLTGRLARRMFVLFALSAFVPLATMAILSLDQVRGILLKQGERRLAGNAKAYGMAVYERLLLAQEVALVTAGRPASGVPEASLAGKAFRSIGTFDAKGQPVAAMEGTRLPALSGESLARLAHGRPVVAVDRAAEPPRVSLVVPAPGGRAVFVAGEIAAEFLWGNAEFFPPATEFCVFEEDSRRVLFCSARGIEAAIALIDTATPQSTLRSLRWQRDGELHRAAAWGQFMRVAFGTPDWIVLASQPESQQLVPVTEFRNVFIPVVALALLLAAWLTIRQVRHILGPVDRLATRARAIAKNDFATPVAMPRNDEFGELAAAFDHMSAKVGRQIATLTALSEIDRLILSAPDIGDVTRVVLERMGEMIPADSLGVMLLDHDDPRRARTFLRAAGRSGALSVVRHDVAAADRAPLEAHPGGTWLGGDAPWPAFLDPLREHGALAAWVQPIAWRGETCGAIVLGFGARPPEGGDEQQQAREFADRLAVAVSSAWRDEQLYLQAHYDALTGLPNRLLFRDRLEREIVRCERESGRLAVLFVDLDNFKAVNDSWGHTAGDDVLREAALRISRCVRDSDTVARLGGDEFTVLLTRIQRAQDAGIVADSISAALCAEYRAGAQRAFLSASIGIASHPGDGATAEDLLRNADTAMYRAKAAGRNAVVFFEDRMNVEVQARHNLDRDLRLALELGQIQVHYQPLADLATGAVCAAEALLRWNHPGHGLIPPARFIPIAEETGVIEPLGQLVLAQACRQLKAWEASGLALQRLGVNVSPRQFRRPGLVEFVRDTVRESGIDPGKLELEITEGMLVERTEAAGETLAALEALGVKIALDDFGTGFSSMAYLTRIPVNTIKIDRVFVSGLGRGPDSEAIVAAIIALSRALGKRTVAEGVETGEQLAILRRLRCDMIQGFLVSPALPADDFAAFARGRAAAG